jgi:hypothetical protein
MKNLLPYPQTEFQNIFSNSNIYKSLTKDFDVVSFEKFIFNNLHKIITPRQYLGDRKLKTYFSAVAFYYLQFLLEKNPSQIYDLGCGWNIFKKYIPNIIGVGAEPVDSEDFFGDIHDYIDDNYIQGHKEYFESVFSICALHFYPIESIAKRVNDFYSMIKPGGRGFLTFNVQRMLDHGNLTFNSPMEVDKFCRHELAGCTHIKFIVVDIDFSVGLDEGIDGNIRLVMEK